MSPGDETLRLTRRSSALVNGKEQLPSGFRTLPSPATLKNDEVREGGGGFSRMFRAVRHVGQNRERVRCELFVERLVLRVPSPKKVSFEWIRGPKRVVSNESHTLHKNVWTCQWTVPSVLDATLFWTLASDGKRKYAAKETCIRFFDVSIPRQKDSRLGEIIFDLAEAAQCNQHQLRATVPLARSLDPSAKVSIRLSLTTLQEDEVIDDLRSTSSSDSTKRGLGVSSNQLEVGASQTLQDSAQALLRRRSMRINNAMPLSKIPGDGSPALSDSEEPARVKMPGNLSYDNLLAPEVVNTFRDNNVMRRVHSSYKNLAHQRESSSPPQSARSQLTRAMSTLASDRVLNSGVMTRRELFAKRATEALPKGEDMLTLAPRTALSPTQDSNPLQRDLSLTRDTNLRLRDDAPVRRRDTSMLRDPERFKEASKQRETFLQMSTLRESVTRDPISSRLREPSATVREHSVRELNNAHTRDHSFTMRDHVALREESMRESPSGYSGDQSIMKEINPPPDPARLMEEQSRSVADKDQHIASLLDQITKLHNALEASYKMRALDKAAYESRLQSTPKSLARASSQVANAQTEALYEERKASTPPLNATQNEELSRAKGEIMKLSAKCQKLESALSQSQASAERSQASRLRELEKLLAEERERASADRLRASQTIAQLTARLEGDSAADTPLSSLTKGELITKIKRMEGVTQADGHRARIVDLEEELVDVKVRLAQVETEKDEVIEKARKRIDALKANCKEYAMTIDSLEREIATLKLGHKRTTGSLKTSANSSKASSSKANSVSAGV